MPARANAHPRASYEVDLIFSALYRDGVFCADKRVVRNDPTTKSPAKYGFSAWLGLLPSARCDRSAHLGCHSIGFPGAFRSPPATHRAPRISLGGSKPTPAQFEKLPLKNNACVDPRLRPGNAYWLAVHLYVRIGQPPIYFGALTIVQWSGAVLTIVFSPSREVGDGYEKHCRRCTAFELWGRQERCHNRCRRFTRCCCLCDRCDRRWRSA